MKNNKGMLVVLSAPSGCGKDTVYKALKELRDDVVESVSATTRSPRNGEINGVNYFFKTVDEFKEMINNNQLLEHTCYNGNYYGTPINGVNKAVDEGKICLLIIEVEGAKNVMKLIPDAVTIFLLPPSIEELERRLMLRGTDDIEDVKSRIEIAREEIKLAPLYDYTVINDDIDDAVAEVNNIINKELEAHNN